MSVKPIPAGYHTVTPYLLASDARKLLDFLKAAFGAVSTEFISDSDGSVAHAEVKIGDSIVMVGGKKNAPLTTSMFYLYVEDTDAVYQQALAAGATSLMEPQNKFYGDRNAAVQDPFGNQWWIATHVEDVSPKELEKRMKAQQQ